jgi:hypothetical protein
MFRVGRKAAVTAMAAMFSTALLGGVALAAFAPVQAATEVVAGAEANKDRGDNLKATLDELVRKNVITQAQEDAILAALAAAKPDRTHEEFLRRVAQEFLAQSASYLGMTMADLRAKLPGTSLGALADATPGKSKDGLVQALTRFASDAIDKAVANGKLTAAQAERAKALLAGHVTKFVEHVFPKKDPRPAAPKVQRPSATKDPSATRAPAPTKAPAATR